MATDEDGQALIYSLVMMPTGKTIVPGTGAISWTPTASQVARHQVTVRWGVVGACNEKDLYRGTLMESGDLAMEEEGDKGKNARHPPFIVYQKKLYVMAKKEGSPQKGGEGSAPVAVVKKPVRRPATAHRRPAQFRPRPYVKGVYRCYSETTPHLVPLRGRRRKKTA